MTKGVIRTQFEEWAKTQWGNQAYQHTSNCCGEFTAYQAGRKAALLEAADYFEHKMHWPFGADDLRRMAEGEKNKN